MILLADYEEALNDFLCPQMVNDAIQAEKAFIFSSPGMPALAFLEEVAESVHENDIYCVTPLQRLIKMVCSKRFFSFISRKKKLLCAL